MKIYKLGPTEIIISKNNRVKIRINISRKWYNFYKKYFTKRNLGKLLASVCLAIFVYYVVYMILFIPNKDDKQLTEMTKQIQKYNKDKNNLLKLENKKKDLERKLEILNNLVEKNKNKLDLEQKNILRKIQNIQNLELKQRIYKEIIGFVPNKYILTHTYYRAPVEKVLFNIEQIKLNWRTNSNGASKPYIPLRGDNKEERLKSLLSLYNLSNTYNYWVNMEKEYKIKKEVLVCIAWADSDLGKQLKSKNNLGNVGNNDRGNVVHFRSIEDGIKAIAKVLNNRYLGGYNMIGELSEGGRENLNLPSCKERGVYCYATSKENWNVNVLNCLSMIYKKPIDEKFIFRVDNYYNKLTYLNNK